MARPKRYVETMVVRFEAGTMAQIKSVLTSGEDRASMIRETVEREIQRRKGDDLCRIEKQ